MPLSKKIHIFNLKTKEGLFRLIKKEFMTFGNKHTFIKKKSFGYFDPSISGFKLNPRLINLVQLRCRSTKHVLTFPFFNS